jgi:hypothetical protein
MGAARVRIAAFLGALLAFPAPAQDTPPVPKLFEGMPGGKGQWQVEFLEGAPGKAKPPTMTLCTDNVVRSQQQQERQAARRAQCTQRLLKDTPTEAVIESACPDATSTVTMTRDGPSSVLMAIQSSGARGERSMKMRYTHLGACREGQGALSFDRDSEQCRKLRARAEKMDPEKACARTKGDRAECEQRMRDTVAKLSEMCK